MSRIPRTSYIVVFLAGILLALLPLLAAIFPWIRWERWAVAAAWWTAMILIIGFLERRDR